MSENVIASAVDLAALFPEWAMSDTRAGYSGYMVAKEHLLDVAAALKNEHGFDYLSSVTGVDYIATDKLEAAYQFYRSIGGPGVMVKVQTDRSNPEIPSLTGLYPGANLQEREVWDLVGIKFTNHPDLRRILTWEGFAGHPLQKDWHEPYFEEDVKPYKSRWPEGHVYRIEDKNPFGDNLQYPAGFDPEQFSPDFDQSLYTSLEKVEKTSADLATDQMVINFGPQHPSTHGVFRMVAILDGETIVDIKPVMGYLHRNHEKLGERNTYLQNMPFTDRLDYVCSMTNNFAYATTVEKLLGIKPPERAEYIRVMMAELTRFMNHMFSIGFILNDLGAMFTPNLYALEERELILDVFEAVSGSRMMCNYFRFGGVVRDLPEGMLDHVKKLVYDRLPRKLEEFDNYLTENEIVKVRCQGVGVLTSDQAIANSATGPTLRASGVPYDIRRAEPYSIYDRLDFDVCVRYHGDIYDRYLIRLDEMRQSLRILQQVVRDIPEGPIMTGKSQYVMKVPAGEVYSRTESPKGELGFYIVSDGTANPYRYHVRAPTFINLTSLSDMCKNGKIADVVTVVGSIDITLAEVDR